MNPLMLYTFDFREWFHLLTPNFMKNSANQMKERNLSTYSNFLPKNQKWVGQGRPPGGRPSHTTRRFPIRSSYGRGVPLTGALF